MGLSHRPGFGLLGSVPRSLSTQPPFATQALMFSFHDLTKFNDSYIKAKTSVIMQCAGWKKESFFQFK